MKTLQELAREALAVQDACNLCGVAQSFARAMIDLGKHTDGTASRNTHPITRLWLDKMNSLAGVGIQYDDYLSDAYKAVYAIVEAAEVKTACTKCGASTGDGEGYDGLCGNCADRAEQHTEQAT